jgi:hypothetical protein
MFVAAASVSMLLLWTENADARISVSQCINSWWSCSIRCPGYVDGPLPPSSNPAGDKNCRNRCDANHAACVDRAMDLSSGRRSTRRRK